MDGLNLVDFLERSRAASRQALGTLVQPVKNKGAEILAAILGNPNVQRGLEVASYSDAPDDLFRTGNAPLFAVAQMVQDARQTGQVDPMQLVEALGKSANAPQLVGEQVGQSIAAGGAYQPETSFGVGADMALSLANPMGWVDLTPPGFGVAARNIDETVGLTAATSERLTKAPGLRRLADVNYRPEVNRATGLTPGGKPTKYFSPERVEEVGRALRSNVNRDELMRVVQQGMQRGGDQWYRGDEILSSLTDALGDPEQAQEFFRVIVALTAATSPRTRVKDNIYRALNLVGEAFSGRPLSELQDLASNTLGRVFPDKSLNAAMFNRGPVSQAWEEGTLNGQKVSSFLANFLDDVNAVTIDTHNLPMVFYLSGMDWREPAGRRAIADLLGMDADEAAGMAAGEFREAFYRDVTSGKNDYLYSTIENVQQELAQEIGVTPRELQALLWVGGKEITGVADDTPFPSLFMAALEEAAQAHNTSFKDIVSRIYNGQLSLADVMPREYQNIIARFARASDAGGDDEEAPILEDALNGFSTGGRF